MHDLGNKGSFDGLHVPYLVSLCLQLFHLVLDHSDLLLVHVTVQGQLLHLEAQALFLLQELNVKYTNEVSNDLGTQNRMYIEICVLCRNTLGDVLYFSCITVYLTDTFVLLN